MNKYSKIIFLLSRLSLGWLFFYAGITKLLDPDWSAGGYLLGAKTFSGVYAWFASPGILPFTNFVNEWGLTLLGATLILGVFVRFSSVLGVILMTLYYFPALVFPHIPPHAYIIDEHIIYALILLLFAGYRVGRYWGLDESLSRGRSWYSKWLG
jgi:thiosulfate dehydrogenase [quinone] large subunit